MAIVLWRWWPSRRPKRQNNTVKRTPRWRCVVVGTWWCVGRAAQSLVSADDALIVAYWMIGRVPAVVRFYTDQRLNVASIVLAGLFHLWNNSFPSDRQSFHYCCCSTPFRSRRPHSVGDEGTRRFCTDFTCRFSFVAAHRSPVGGLSFWETRRLGFDLFGVRENEQHLFINSNRVHPVGWVKKSTDIG